MRPGPKARRETRDANAEEATGEKQLLRLERPFQTAGPTYNVIQNARGFLTKQVMRCRARLTAPLGRAQPPLSTTPYERAQLELLVVRQAVAARFGGKLQVVQIAEARVDALLLPERCLISREHLSVQAVSAGGRPPDKNLRLAVSPDSNWLRT